MNALPLVLFMFFASFALQSQIDLGDSLVGLNALNNKSQISLNDSSLDLSRPISSPVLDSSILDYINSITFIKKPFDSVSISSDSLKSKFAKLRSKINPLGNVLVGFDYGLLTGYLDTSNTDPISVLRSEGDISLNALGLPLRFSYNYSSFRNPLGVNNFIRFSLDTEKLEMQSRAKKQELLDGFDEKLSNINEAKRGLSSKLGYAEVLKQKLKGEIETRKRELAAFPERIRAQQDSLINLGLDTSQLTSIPLDSSQLASIPLDSLRQAKSDSFSQTYTKAQDSYQKAVKTYDTIQKVYERSRKVYDTYVLWETKLKKKKASIEEGSGGFLGTALNERANKMASEHKEGFLSKVKTFDIGMSYPQTTALSSNSAPIKGLNVAIQHKKWYSSLAAGVLMNNLMVSNDIVQNRLLYSQNLFNQFDFQEVTSQGFLVNLKSGLGTVEGTHAFLGFRYLTNAKLALDGMGDDTTDLVPTVGLELDLKAVPSFLPGTIIDFVYGKTSDSRKVKNKLRPGPISSLFSSDRTHTSLLKVTQPFSKMRSVLSASIRWLDPDADVKSIGVLQPNNLRYELKSRHKLSKRLNVGFSYRLDRNNLDQILDTTIHLSIVGGQLDGSFSRSLHYFGSLNYLVQQEQDRGTFIQKRNNYMYGAGISAQYKIKEVSNSLVVSYNDYLLTDSVSTALFRNIGLQHLSKWSLFKNTFSINYFETSEETTSQIQSTLVGDEVSFETDRFTLTAGLKLAFQDDGTTDYGGKFELVTQLNKLLNWSIRVEKLVLGDFYRAYDQGRFNRFPYVISTNLNFTIH